MAEGVAINFRATGVETVKGAFKAVQQGFASLRGKGPKESQGLMATLSGVGNFVTGIKSTVDFVEQKVGQVVRLLKGLASTTIELAGLGGEALGVEQAFAGLVAKGGEVAEVMLTKVSAALNHTVAEVTLMKNINVALQLGLPGTADQMAELADVAQRLGRAVGRGPTAAFQDLVTGIGRQSRLILDNLGIIVDTEKAYDTFAKTLNKSVADLSDAEKKQAFFNATLSKGKEAVTAMGDEQLTATDNIATVTAAWSDMKAEIGKVIATSPGFKRLMTGIRDMIKNVVDFVGQNSDFITGFLNSIFGMVQELAQFFLTVFIPVLKLIMTIAKAVLAVVTPLIQGVTKMVSLVFGSAGGGAPETAATMPSPLLLPFGALGALMGGGGGGQTNIDVKVNAAGVSSREAITGAFNDAKNQVFSQMDGMDREIRRQGRMMEQESKSKMY